ncbi:MAG: flagellar biosynthesis protein FlhB [Pirellulales bacterium]|nr:flagellar biosynthesis protein FlhB [Pirellulales bacterium]
MADGEKSQDPTPHRREQAREEGQVVHSQDLAAAVLLLIALVVLLNLGSWIVQFFLGLGEEHWGGSAWIALDPDTFVNHWWQVLAGLARALVPLLGILFLAGILVHLFQVGILFLPDKLLPDFSRINPLEGFGRLFSWQSVVTVALGLFKIGVVGTVAYVTFRSQETAMLNLAGRDIPEIALFLVETVLWTCIKVTAALVILAMLDYFYQYWRHEQNLKMSPDEIREEMKNQQGDPQTIARRRQIQRQLAASRLKSAVPKADVVITNPTELAIAIQYDATTMHAPIVVAKGAGVVAQRIRKLALEHGIPVIEKKPLAQALFKEVDLNHPIPDKMYAAVAEILAYVYQLKGKNMPEK